ncbi:MAG: hypothetical protein ABR920_01430 [Terriglobales bacterium]
MEKSSSRTIATLAAFVPALISLCSILSFGQSTTSGKQDAQAGSQHNQVQLSEEIPVQDRVTVKLTPGQKKAVADSKTLGPDSAAVFKPDGTLVQKGSVKELDKVFKACKDLRPISDKCWLCKDDGTILCSSRQQQLKPAPSTSHVNPNSP